MLELFLVQRILDFAFYYSSISVVTSAHCLISKFLGYPVLIGACFSSLTRYISKNLLFLLNQTAP